MTEQSFLGDHIAARSRTPNGYWNSIGEYVSPSYTRSYPLVARRGRGAMVEDVDGNIFLDFAAGIAVVATGHCHPEVVAAIQQQAAELIHMSGTGFLLREHGGAGAEARGHRAGHWSPSAFTSETPAPKPSRRPSSWRAITRGAKRSSPFTAASTAAPWARYR